MFTNRLNLIVVIGAMLVLGAVVLTWNVVAANQATTQLGKEFSLKIGQQAKVEGVDLTLKFAGVPQDSRCPSNVNCVWAGNAEVAVEFVHDKCTTLLTLNTHPRSEASDQGKVSGLLIKLVKLDPYPRSDQKISASDYTATFIVTKE